MRRESKGKIQRKFHAKTREEWKNWLEENHDKTLEIWLIFYRPHTERQNISHKESIEEAAHFEWKQTMTKRVDDDSYVRKFVPIKLPEKKVRLVDKYKRRK